jgi:hypothetical protein
MECDKANATTTDDRAVPPNKICWNGFRVLLQNVLVLAKNVNIRDYGKNAVTTAKIAVATAITAFYGILRHFTAFTTFYGIYGNLRNFSTVFTAIIYGNVATLTSFTFRIICMSFLLLFQIFRIATFYQFSH